MIYLKEERRKKKHLIKHLLKDYYLLKTNRRDPILILRFSTISFRKVKARLSSYKQRDVRIRTRVYI